MKKYITPKAELNILSCTDVIRTSGIITIEEDTGIEWGELHLK